MLKPAAAALMITFVVTLSSFSQTHNGSCTASVDSISPADDHIDVYSHVTLSGCTQPTWQEVDVHFLSNTAGNDCINAEPCSTVSSHDVFWTQCLAEGVYTVSATPQCHASDICSFPSTAGQMTFTLTRTVNLGSVSAQQNPPNSDYWDITAGYDIPNTGELDRAVHVYDAKTMAMIGGCP